MLSKEQDSDSYPPSLDERIFESEEIRKKMFEEQLKMAVRLAELEKALSESNQKAEHAEKEKVELKLKSESLERQNAEKDNTLQSSHLRLQEVQQAAEKDKHLREMAEIEKEKAKQEVDKVRETAQKEINLLSQQKFIVEQELQ